MRRGWTRQACDQSPVSHRCHCKAPPGSANSAPVSTVRRDLLGIPTVTVLSFIRSRLRGWSRFRGQDSAGIGFEPTLRVVRSIPRLIAVYCSLLQLLGRAPACRLAARTAIEAEIVRSPASQVCSTHAVDRPSPRVAQLIGFAARHRAPIGHQARLFQYRIEDGSPRSPPREICWTLSRSRVRLGGGRAHSPDYPYYNASSQAVNSCGATA